MKSGRSYSSCHNKESLDQDSVNNIPLNKLYVLTELQKGKKFHYCFDIDQLFHWITRKRNNPYTNGKISNTQMLDILNTYYNQNIKSQLPLKGRKKFLMVN